MEESGEGLGAEHAQVVFHFQHHGFCVYVVYSGNIGAAPGDTKSTVWMTWSFFLDDALVLENHIGAAYVNSDPMSYL